MEAQAPAVPVSGVLHPRAGAFTAAVERDLEVRIGFLFAATGVALIAVMGVLGLLMRLTQATVLGISQAWFYRLMTLHGAGMITATLLAMMGALWYVLRASVPLRPERMLAAYVLIVGGAVAVLVATLVGGFAAGWAFLPPLPFYPAGQWTTWSETVFFLGLLGVGSGFMVFCIDVVEQTTETYGGLVRTLGLRFLAGRESDAPPPEAIAATVVAIDGLLASTAGTAIVVGLLGHSWDSGISYDALVAKNLVYFFGHSVANLVIYLAAGAIYVLVPRYAGRPYAATKVFVAGWMASFVFIATAYSHHLYMDFVQPTWAEIVSETVSYFALLPVAVITIYSMTMLVWGSQYKWTLSSTLLYVGFAGWAIGGVGAVIDSLIPFNFRLHNTDWVVAHFHTYLMLCVVLWVLAFLAHLLERETGDTSPTTWRAAALTLMLVGGYGLTGTWFVAGTLGVPRRYALQPAGTAGYSLVGGIFALLFAAGFVVVLAQMLPLAGRAWGRIRAPVATAASARSSGAPVRRAPMPPLTTAAQFAVAAGLAVVGLAAFAPQVVDAAGASARYHHLDHAGQFFFGAVLGLMLGSLPRVSAWLGDRANAGLAAVVAAPTVMMAMMVPRFYESLEHHTFEHLLYHLGMAAFGLAAGLGATRLGVVAGRLTFALAVAMPVLFAAAVK